MERHETKFPKNADNFLNVYLKELWENGLLDNYPEEHFLIKAIEGDIECFHWLNQFVNNNVPSMYTPINLYGMDYNSFTRNFLINFSQKLKCLSKNFGSKKFDKFIKEQMAANGKN